MSDEQEMSLRFFGYGKWGAKYWFIGPEQGKGTKEQPGNDHRVKAWVKLGKPEVCDIQAFHSEIEQICYFQQRPAKAPLQSTWKKLILVLLAAMGNPNPSNPETRRDYQSTKWGRENGETCVIELSGLAARGFREEADRERFLQPRIDAIIKKIDEHKPQIVLMYGIDKRERASWSRIAGVDLIEEQPVRSGATTFVLMAHTNTFGRRNWDWEKLGRKLNDFDHDRSAGI